MKQTIKSLVVTLFVVLQLPLLFCYWISKFILNKNSVFAAFSQFLSLIPGFFGSYMRVAFYRMTMTKCEGEMYIGFNALFAQFDTELYHGVYIGAQCNIGSSVIKKNALLGSGVHILSGKSQHNIDDLDMPIRLQGGQFDKISIGEDSWVGNNAVIMANVGDKCIVGAGSVVIEDVPDYAVVVGNPAKIIKMRNAHQTENR